MIEAEKWEMEGFSLWRPCALTMRYPNTIIFFFSLCIVFSLSLSFFSLFFLFLCLSAFQVLSWLSFFLNTQPRPLATSQPWAVWSVNLFDRVYFFTHIFLCCSLCGHMSMHLCVLQAQCSRTQILGFCQCTR